MMQVTDEWLYEKMPVVDAAIIQRVEDMTDFDYTFSDTFEQKMAKLLRQEKYIGMMSRLKNISGRVAVFALVLVTAFFSVTMSVEAYRVRFFATIKTVLEDHTGIYSYRTMDETKNAADTMAEPQYVPAGYRQENAKQSEKAALYEYSSGDKELIFQQKIVSDEKELYDESYDRMERLSANGVDVCVHWYENDTFWAYAEYQDSVYVLSGDTITTDEIVKIYEKWAF